MTPKTACVVGAGCAGIAALKECVRQGFKPVCYELDSDIGGIWHKKDYSRPTNTPAVWDNLVMNASKFNYSYSDLPPLFKETPYRTVEGMHQYFQRAVQHFGLESYIQFNTRVIKIRKTSDHDTTGRWEVFTARRGDDVFGSDRAGPRGDDQLLSGCHREVFDFVLVCTGCFKVPKYPDIAGIDTFKGGVHHSFSYSSPKPFDGINVLVVGNFVSAIDIANDIAHVAKQVYIAVGEGTWILPKCYAKARTLDMLFSRSFMYQRNGLAKMNEALIELANARIDHESVGIRPSKPPLLSPVATSEDIQVYIAVGEGTWILPKCYAKARTLDMLFSRSFMYQRNGLAKMNEALIELANARIDHESAKILAGKVRIYGRLTRLQQDQAHFLDGKVISGIEAVVFCTGCSLDLSFLDLQIIDGNGKMELHKMTFPVKEKHHSLALIGQFGLDSALAICFDLQARLATRVMAGKHKLPSSDQMKKDADSWNAEAFARRGKYDSYLLNGVPMTEHLALEVGCYPTFWKIFLRDPRLAFRVWYGPMFAAQYRLLGPDSQWEQAAKVCHAFYEEGYSSLRLRELSKSHQSGVYGYDKIKLSIISSVTAVVGYLAYRYHMTQQIGFL